MAHVRCPPPRQGRRYHHLYVLGLRGLSPPEDEIEAPEDVLGQVDALGSLRNASQGHRGDSASRNGRKRTTRQTFSKQAINEKNVTFNTHAAHRQSVNEKTIVMKYQVRGSALFYTCEGFT